MSKKSMELMKIIDDGVKAVFESQTYMDFLKFAAKFHHYSANNIVLLYRQKPDASFVAGFSTWKSMGKDRKDIRIKKGSRALYVIAPRSRKETDEQGNEVVRLYFKAAPVFDISQVSGVEIPEFCPQLQGDVENYGDLLDVLVSKVSPVPVSFREFDGEALGYYNPDALEIVVRPGMSQLQTIKTLLHEQAHAWAMSSLPEGEKLDRHDNETIAESVAFITAEFLGLDTSDYSFPYLASWTGEGKSTEMLRKNLDMIIKTSDHMIRLIEDLQGKEEAA